MNPELHHRWNAERDPQRESKNECAQVLKEEIDKNKVTLKQNKPR